MSDTLPINRRQFLAGAAAGSTALMLAHGAALAATGASKMTTTSTSGGAFWPNGARLAISISMQFEAGAQPERGASGPFPPLHPKYADLPMQSWYDYGVKEGIPRLLDLWDRTGVKVTSHMVGQAVPQPAAGARDRGARPRGGGARPKPGSRNTR